MATSQPDKLAEPWTVEVVAKDSSGRAYAALDPKHGDTAGKDRDERGHFVQSSQPDNSGPKTVEVVAKDFDKSPKFVQRSYQFVKVLDSIEEKTSPEVIAEETGVTSPPSSDLT